MFENLTKSVSHIVCLIWKFSRGGWRTAFLPGNTKWRTNCYRLCSSIKNAHFKEFWILILQYNNSLRAPWKRCATLEPKSKHGSKESWIPPNGHKSRLIENSINRYTTKISTSRDHNAFIFSTMIWFFAKGKLLFVAFLSTIHPHPPPLYHTPFQFTINQWALHAMDCDCVGSERWHIDYKIFLLKIVYFISTFFYVQFH